MSPIQRDYLIYAIAIAFGFGVYVVIDQVFKAEFSYALFGGFAAIHLAIVTGRKLIP